MAGFHQVKITEIPETRFGTRPVMDAEGQIHHAAEQYTVFREVQVVKGWSRFGHYLIDALIIYVLQIFVNALTGFAVAAQVIEPGTIEELKFRLMASGVGMIITLLYYATFEILLSSSPGKLMMGRIVIDEYGLKPTPGTILLRSLCRLVPFEAFSCLFDRGWHDRWSKTYVVHQTEADTLWSLLEKTERDRTQQEAEIFRQSQDNLQS